VQTYKNYVLRRLWVLYWQEIRSYIPAVNEHDDFVNKSITLHVTVYNEMKHRSVWYYLWLCPVASTKLKRDFVPFIRHLNSLQDLSQSWESELFYDWRFTANQFVLATRPLRLTTSNFIFQLNTSGYAIYNCCWSSPAQSFSTPSPSGLMTIFYSLRFETPPSWRARSLYLYAPGTWWPSYSPRHWIPMKMSVFWYIIPCRPVKLNWRFGG
jgi:hypothetical protein